MGYAQVYQQWQQDPEGFWLSAAEGIDWVTRPTRALNAARAAPLRPERHTPNSISTLRTNDRRRSCKEAAAMSIAAARVLPIASLTSAAVGGIQ